MFVKSSSISSQIDDAPVYSGKDLKTTAPEGLYVSTASTNPDAVMIVLAKHRGDINGIGLVPETKRVLLTYYFDQKLLVPGTPISTSTWSRCNQSVSLHLKLQN